MFCRPGPRKLFRPALPKLKTVVEVAAAFAGSLALKAHVLNHVCGVCVRRPLHVVPAVGSTPATTNARSLAPVFDASESLVVAENGRPLWNVATLVTFQPLNNALTTADPLFHRRPSPNGRSKIAVVTERSF